MDAVKSVAAQADSGSTPDTARAAGNYPGCHEKERKMTMIENAFHAVCADAQPAKASYVSLYVTVPFYGGPEEGGWWGRDDELVAYHRCTNEVEAEAVKAEVMALAARMSKEAKDAFNRRCADETEWLEARGLEDDFLPEVDGEESYFVAVEDRPGSLAHEAERHYS
jgi:hypothetical protein